MKYQVLWDNGHACSFFPYVFESPEEAEDFGKSWLYDMAGIDPNPENAKYYYSYEVIEVTRIRDD